MNSNENMLDQGNRDGANYIGERIPLQEQQGQQEQHEHLLQIPGPGPGPGDVPNLEYVPDQPLDIDHLPHPHPLMEINHLAGGDVSEGVEHTSIVHGTHESGHHLPHQQYRHLLLTDHLQEQPFLPNGVHTDSQQGYIQQQPSVPMYHTYRTLPVTVPLDIDIDYHQPTQPQPHPHQYQYLHNFQHEYQPPHSVVAPITLGMHASNNSSSSNTHQPAVITLGMHAVSNSNCSSSSSNSSRNNSSSMHTQINAGMSTNQSGIHAMQH
jgi:hypothetical protein